MPIALRRGGRWRVRWMAPLSSVPERLRSRGRIPVPDFVSRPNARPFGGQLAGLRAETRAAGRLLPLSRVRKPSDSWEAGRQMRVFDAVGPFAW